MGFRFVHAADLHLDTPFKGIGSVAPEVGRALRDASLTAFGRLVELCLERDAAFLVIAGDVYDGAERGIRAQLRFRDGLGRLSDAGISSFVVHGNHDPVGGWSAVGSWPALTTVFGAEQVGSVEVRRAGELLAVVHGISYGRRDVRENLALRFRRSPGEAFQVGVLHCNVSGAAEGHEDYSPCSLADLLGIGLDYWALGHIHARSVLSGRPHGDEPYVVYPGNLQARSPKASERGPKGASVVEVEAGRVQSVEAVACDVARFADGELDLAACGDLDDVRDGLVDLAGEQLEQADGRSVVLRAYLTGASELHRAFTAPAAMEELTAAVRAELPAGDRFCWLDRVVDESASPRDLDALRAGSDFTGDLIRLADELAASPDDLEALVADLGATLPKALQGRFAGLAALATSPGPEHLCGVVAPALSAALDELGGDG